MAREVSPLEAAIVICARFIMSATIQTLDLLKSLLRQTLRIFGKMIDRSLLEPA
jgi:hypothetical protein